MLAALAFRAVADVNVGVEIHAKADFEAPLAASGRWVVAGRLGRCWRPMGVEAGWRPYCSGEWVWTDCGWYWASEEPWAWACYHYGSWMDDPALGWIWIPDIEWSPAWVTWRTGGGYIGWAPCAPAGVVVAPALFAFVQIGHFRDPVLRTRLVFNDPVIIKNTTEIRRVRHESHDLGGGRSQKVTINEGPQPGEVEKATGKKLAAVPIKEAARRTPPPRSVAPAKAPREGASEAKPGGAPKPETPATAAPSRTPVAPGRPGTNAAPAKPVMPEKPLVPEKPQTPPKPESPTRPEPPGRGVAPPGGGVQPSTPSTPPSRPPADKDKMGNG